MAGRPKRRARMATDGKCPTSAKTAKGKSQKPDPHHVVTDRIVEALERGDVPPWRKPWNASIAAPRNGASGRTYSGINRLLAMCHEGYMSTGDPRFFTFKGARDMGGAVRKGEKAMDVAFTARVPRKCSEDDPDAEWNAEKERFEKEVPILSLSKVFHASQCDNIPAWVPPEAWKGGEPTDAPEAVRKVVDRSGVDFREGGGSAFYNPEADFVHVPRIETFEDGHAWGATVLHEMSHWTGGAEDRVPRKLSTRDRESYAFEELRAEIASAFSCGRLGVEAEPDRTTAYVASWLEALRNDKKFIFDASRDAEKIADFLCEFAPEHDLKADVEAQAEAKAKADVAAVEAEAADATPDTTAEPRAEAEPQAAVETQAAPQPEPEPEPKKPRQVAREAMEILERHGDSEMPDDRKEARAQAEDGRDAWQIARTMAGAVAFRSMRAEEIVSAFRENGGEPTDAHVDTAFNLAALNLSSEDAARKLADIRPGGGTPEPEPDPEPEPSARPREPEPLGAFMGF